MFPQIDPASIMQNSLASSTPVANTSLGAFLPWGVLIGGVFVGIGVLLIIIALFGRLLKVIQLHQGYKQLEFDNQERQLSQKTGVKYRTLYDKFGRARGYEKFD